MGARSGWLSHLTRALVPLRYGVAPLLPPGSSLRGRVDPVARLRRLAREDLDGLGPAPSWARLAVSPLWPGLVLLRALKNLRRHGGAALATAGVSRGRQLLELLRLAWRHDLAPKSYYELGLFQSGGRDRAAEAIQGHELRALHRRLNAGLDWGRLDDKRRFAAHCRTHGLPTPALVLEAEGGQLRWHLEPAVLPPRDLVLKPASLRGGRGVEVWRRAGQGPRWERGGQVLDADGLLERVSSQGRERPTLLQERVALHPDLLDLSPGGTLCTARVVTWRAPDGQGGLIEAFVRLPGRAGQEADNMHQGGIGAVIDRERGVLKAGSRLPDRFVQHPLTGARIEGRPVPGWEALVPLCRRAHDASPEFLCVGWDVGLGAEGPVLIEANSMWGVPSDPLLGETELPRLALERLGLA